MALDKASLDALKIDPEDRARKRAGWVAPALSVAVLLLGGAAVTAWFFRAEPVPEVSTVLAASPSAGVTSAVLNASGYVVARRIATVSSKVTGKIVEVLVEEGLAVTVDDVLARLDDSAVRAQAALAQSQLDAALSALSETQVRLAEARRDLVRQTKLREDRLVSEAALDAADSEVKALAARLVSARSQVSVAESAFAVREQDLDDLVIRAPFSGVVISKNAQPGEMISPISAGGSFTRSGICTIVDMDSREIEVDVNEAYINRVSANQPVTARLDAYPDWEIPARVINIVPTADRQKATVRVRIAFEALDERILPDMGIKVEFMDAAVPERDPEPRSQVLASLPADAVRDDGGKTFVWILSDDTIERRAVSLGRQRGGTVEVIAGVRPGERVVVGDDAGLRDGARAAVR